MNDKCKNDILTSIITIGLLVGFVVLAFMNSGIYIEKRTEDIKTTNILRREKIYSSSELPLDENKVMEITDPVYVSNHSGVEYTETESGFTITGYHGNRTSIELPEYIDGHHITSISAEAFKGSGLVYVKCPDSIKTIGQGAFSYSYNLRKIDAPGVTTIEDRAFAICKQLEEITYSNKITKIGDSAFSMCGMIEKLDIPGTLEYIGQNAFSETKITEIEIPGTVKTINNCLFSGCQSLKTVIFDEGIETVGARIFLQCDSLETVYLPTTVISVDDDALGNLDQTEINFEYDKNADNADMIDKFIAVEIAEMQPIKTNSHKEMELEE